MGKVKNLLPDQPDEGDICPVEDCTGTLQLEDTVNCSCHISGLCNACMNRSYECDTCHEVFD